MVNLNLGVSMKLFETILIPKDGKPNVPKKGESGVAYWEYFAVVAIIGLAATAAVPNIKAQLTAVDQRLSTVADNYDRYPVPLVP